MSVFDSFALYNPGTWVQHDISIDPRMKSLQCPKCNSITNHPETRYIPAVDYNGYGGIMPYMEVVCAKCWYVDKIYEWTLEGVGAPPSTSDKVFGCILSVVLIGTFVGLPLVGLIGIIANWW
jgi:hypothetical protein